VIKAEGDAEAAALVSEALSKYGNGKMQPVTLSPFVPTRTSLFPSLPLCFVPRVQV
jgi:hypothetical protein